MPEMMKLLGSTKSRITKDESGENVPHLAITEVVLFIAILPTLLTKFKSLKYICS